MKNFISILFSIALFLVTLLSSCDIFPKRKEFVMVDGYPFPIDSIEYKNSMEPIYKITNKTFYSILDTAVQNEPNCRLYREVESGFKITTYNYHDSLIVLLSSAYIFDYDYEKVEGVFDYKGFRFLIATKHNFDFLQKTDSMTEIVYYDFDYNNRQLADDDRFSTYHLRINENLIEIAGYAQCLGEKK